MSANTTGTRAPLYSTLADDPDMAPLVEMFVGDLPERTQALLDCLQASDAESLARLAHQIKGAAGSYGFVTITAEAAVVENAVRNHRSEIEIAAAVNSLIDLCRRARAGCE